ncbi:MAG TPA: thioredoxin family protein [Gemmataceae bacterium]|nr:thioredoxin family protein [Gemmataceae bacterium]
MARLVVFGLALVLVVPALGDNPRKDKVTVNKPAKVVMLYFYANWCAPCRVLNETTLRDSTVREFLTDRTTTVRVNIEDDALLAEHYKVRAIPCLVFLDGAGKELGRILGSRGPKQFLEEAGKIVK